MDAVKDDTLTRFVSEGVIYVRTSHETTADLLQAWRELPQVNKCAAEVLSITCALHMHRL